MWYLYMLIGLYLLTPILKGFVKDASPKTGAIALTVLSVMSSILPVMSKYGVSLKGWMILTNNPYILLYLTGYYLAFSNLERIKMWHIITVIAICIAVIVFKLIIGIDYMLYYDPNTVVFAVAIFMLFRKLDIRWNVAERLAPYCFGIYLTHTIFLNALAKVLHISPADYLDPWISVPLLAIGTFMAALLSSYLLSNIPPLKKYVL